MPRLFVIRGAASSSVMLATPRLSVIRATAPRAASFASFRDSGDGPTDCSSLCVLSAGGRGAASSPLQARQERAPRETETDALSFRAQRGTGPCSKGALLSVRDDPRVVRHRPACVPRAFRFIRLPPVGVPSARTAPGRRSPDVSVPTPSLPARDDAFPRDAYPSSSCGVRAVCSCRPGACRF